MPESFEFFLAFYSPLEQQKEVKMITCQKKSKKPERCFRQARIAGVEELLRTAGAVLFGLEHFVADTRKTLIRSLPTELTQHHKSTHLFWEET